jgi:3-phenylpropionate/trans-cinnamate dioxygenase ferredoxin subunit
MPEFRRVARRDEVPPGEARAFDVDGVPIAIYNVEGEFYATCDTCSHEEASLADGWLDDDVVTCPSHGAEFNVRTGEVLSLPATEPIATYPVRVEGDDIFVGIGE